VGHVEPRAATSRVAARLTQTVTTFVVMIYGVIPWEDLDIGLRSGLESTGTGGRPSR